MHAMLGRHADYVMNRAQKEIPTTPLDDDDGDKDEEMSSNSPPSGTGAPTDSGDGAGGGRGRGRLGRLGRPSGSCVCRSQLEASCGDAPDGADANWLMPVRGRQSSVDTAFVSMGQ